MRERISSQSSFKECLSRQIAEARQIHYSKDELLNSKHEYNPICLARVEVEESMYKRKKREKKEEEKSVMEKKAWNEFKSSRGADKRRQEQDVPDEWNQMIGKRSRLDLDLLSTGREPQP